MKSEDRERKKAWKAKQRADAEAALPYSKTELMNLFDFLDLELERRGCDRTLALTIEWANRQGLSADKVVDWTREYGGFCDCEVLANVPSSNPVLGGLKT
jgi:hypothetical protein